MKTFLLVAFSCCLLLPACQESKYIPEGLRKLTPEEMITKAEKGDWGNAGDVILKDEKGNIIPRDSLRKITDFDAFWTDPYANKDGKVVEAIMRQATPADKKLRDRINKVMNQGPDVKMVEVDCANKQDFLQGIYESDQYKRTERIDPKVDHENLGKIVSFLGKCGVPKKSEVSEVQMAAIWAVLQHGSLRYRKQYLPMLTAAAKRGDMDKGVIGMMKDRNLMDEGKPQIYGTQIRGNQLYTLFNPEFVNKRRKEIGLGPIQEYLDRWNIFFEVPQKE